MGINEEYSLAISRLIDDEDVRAYANESRPVRRALAALRQEEFMQVTGASRATAWRRVRAALAGESYGKNWGGARR